MLPGFNHNIRYREIVFHVQTEDSGPSLNTVVTQLFLGGHVLAVERFRYDDLLSLELEDAERRAALKGRMQEQHKTMLRDLTAGRFDAQLESRSAAAEDHVPDPDGMLPAAPTSALDARLPEALLRAAELLPEAPLALTEDHARATAHGARTSILRPPSSTVADLEEISVEGLVDNIEEWSESAPPTGPAPQSFPASPQDTIVDPNLPAALRAAQEKLKQRGARANAPTTRPPTAATFRRVEVREVPPNPAAPGRPRPSTRELPPNDQTMLEIDPMALRQAMARQRAQLEAQKKAAAESNQPGRADEPRVVSEPSLDEVIMGYLDDD